MKEVGADWYLVLTDDFHASEYVGEYFKCRAYVSGFTGSAGTLLVGPDFAGLWTDGRYFLQAGQQLEGSGITLCKMGEPGVPTLPDYLKAHLQPGQVLAYDGRTVNALYHSQMEAIAEGCKAKVRCRMDLVGDIWENRPARSAKPVFELGTEYAGRSRAEKLAALRSDLRKAGADSLVLSSLADIAWLLNIRGGDVACTPVVLSFLAVTPKETVLFVNPAVLDPEIREHLAEDGVKTMDYDGIYDYVSCLEAGSVLMMDLSSVNCAIASAVPQGVKVLDHQNPTELPKATKNPVEVTNFRAAHVKDGVAVTRFMYWLKHNIGKAEITEISAAKVLEGFRREQENYVGPSFSPIMAWGPHGAIVHYSATPESNAVVEPRSFLLADTGGHYMEGTTDITRTFAMGPLTEEEKRCYTLVLKGHLNLSAAVFRHGTTGMNLDVLARQPMWDARMDYNHGTGHGVGYLLNVHEGPQNIRWKTATGTSAVMEEGMVTSNEPGVYLEGKFGVRLENLVVCTEESTNEFCKFLHFENLTMVPFDRDALDISLLTEAEKAILNRYHAQVRETIAPRLPAEEAAWLEEITAEI